MANRRSFYSVTWTENGSSRQSMTFERLVNARKCAARIVSYGHSEVTIWKGGPGGERVE